MGPSNWMVLPSFLLLLVIVQASKVVENTGLGDEELDQEEERASMDDGSIDYYYNDIFDYNDDARAGCNDALPGKFSTESSCKKLKQTCTKLKNKCTWKFNGALGNSNNAKTCKNKLGWYKNRKVEDHCKITCKKCAHGKWTNWGSYGACTKTCGGGTKTKTRTCTNPAPFGGGDTCPGSDSSSTSCNTDDCPINGNWATWGVWTTCTSTCGPNGTRTRDRTCTDPAPLHGGDDCSSTISGDLETESCNTEINCPVHGDWATWGVWTECTSTCGPNGTRTRDRTCTDPTPLYGGDDCNSTISGNLETETCNTEINCPVHGNWATWGVWSECTTTCGPDGMRERNRTCTDPATLHGGDDCDDSINGDVEAETCNTEIICPVNGGWGTWESWGRCSLSCGSGTQSRMRACDSPAQAGTGLDCVGEDTEFQSCNTESCDSATTQAPVDGNWGSWGSWSSCSKTCDTGITKRTRDCDDPAPVGMGADCVGDSKETSICIEESCVADGFTVTSELTFSDGVTSSNFDSIKEDLAAAIADVLGVDSSTVSLTLKSDLRSSSIVVVVTITTTDEDIADNLQDDIDSNSFVSDVNTEVNSSPSLSAAGVVLDYVDETACGGCEPTLGEKEPLDKCRNRLDYRTCGKAAMKGKCSRSWWQFFCKATCKMCCGNIWGDKRCDRLKFLCKKKRKAGAEVRKKCRKACGTCK